MKKLRVRFWDWVFSWATTLSNHALERRSASCGCVMCAHVHSVIKAVQVAQKLRAAIRQQTFPHANVPRLDADIPSHDGAVN